MTQSSRFDTRQMPTLRVGQLVEVRSAAEILATLDDRGELDNLPFMPEMLQYCGRRMTVHKASHKLCDTMGATGLRWMNSAVHLTDARCSGQGHGGCQTACSMYFKEAWLKPVTRDDVAPTPTASEMSARTALAELVERNARKAPGPDGDVRYSCQATELLRAAPTRLRFWDVGQYVADLRTGNVGLGQLLRTFFVGLFNGYQRRSARTLPAWLRIKEGLPWGFVKGSAVGKTPTAKLDLQPGEFVRIRSKAEIMGTLDAHRLNRGMGFEEEMARSCGRTARVVTRVERCIEEKTGRMLTMKNPCIVLDGVICEGAYHGNCPREFLPFWREAWLERVEAPQSMTADAACPGHRHCDPVLGGSPS